MNDTPSGQPPTARKSEPDMRCDECVAADRPETWARQSVEIAAIFVILAGIYWALRHFELFPSGIPISDNLGLGLVFFIGLAASVSTCMAVTGGLLVAIAARYSAAHAEAGRETFKLHGYFNVGRLVGYATLGGAIGALGSAIAFSAPVSGALMLLASLIMIVFGLQMLRLLPWLGLSRRILPKAWIDKIQSYAARETKPAALCSVRRPSSFPAASPRRFSSMCLPRAVR